MVIEGAFIVGDIWRVKVLKCGFQVNAVVGVT